MKGIGPNNLGMSKPAGDYCCGIPDCDHNDSAAKFNDKLRTQAKLGNLPANFAKAVMSDKTAAPLKKKNCSY